MNRRAKYLLGVALATAAIAGGVGVAYAQEAAVVASARGAGLVGEQADGYLGFVKSPPADLKAAVDAINIKRRAIYTDIAAKQNATVAEVATARGCDQLANRVRDGEMYKLSDGAWRQKSGPISLPAVCG